MMKKYLLLWVTVLLALLIPLSGCQSVTDALDQHFSEPPHNEEDDPSLNVELPDRTGRTYTVLLTTQLESADTLTTVSLLTFRTAEESVHWLSLPTTLYVRSAGNHLEGSFKRAYQNELTSESGTTVSATAAGVASIRSLLETGFSIPIDYSINLDGEQFGQLIGTLNNIPLQLYQETGGLSAGEHTLTAESAKRFLLYDGYKDPVEGQYEARRCFAAALKRQVSKIIGNDNLSLYSMELRGEMTTDIPNKGGEDIFFLRRFMKAKDENFCITHISTQNIYYSGIQCRVLVKSNALRQLNEQMMIYEDELTAAQFDPSGVFADFSNQLMQTAYTSSSELPRLYTVTELLTAPEKEPTTEPESGPLTEPEAEPSEG